MFTQFFLLETETDASSDVSVVALRQRLPAMSKEHPARPSEVVAAEVLVQQTAEAAAPAEVASPVQQGTEAHVESEPTVVETFVVSVPQAEQPSAGVMDVDAPPKAHTSSPKAARKRRAFKSSTNTASQNEETEATQSHEEGAISSF